MPTSEIVWIAVRPSTVSGYMIKDKTEGHKKLNKIVNTFVAQLNDGDRFKLAKMVHSATKEESKLRPEAIFDVGFNFWASRVFLTAAELELFSLLEEEGHKKMTAGQIAKKLGLNKKATPDFLDTLVSSGWLCRDGPKDDKRFLYYNTKECSKLMDKTKPTYVGGIVQLFSRLYYPAFGGLSATIKTGKRQTPGCETGVSMYQYMSSHTEMMQEFTYGMMCKMHKACLEVAKFRLFKKAKVVTDIGGGSGQLSCLLAKAYPHIQHNVTELPWVVPICQGFIDRLWPEVKDRVQVIGQDFLDESTIFPPSDIFCFSLVCLEWGEEVNKSLMRKAHAALNAGGAVIIIDSLVDDDRREDAWALSNGLLMIINSVCRPACLQCTEHSISLQLSF